MLVMNWAAKAIHIFISILLCVSLFATGLMAAPDCGARCCCSAASQVNTHHAMTMKIQSSKGCCSGNAPMPCDIQNAQPIELPDALSASSHNVNLPNTGSLAGQNVLESDTNASSIFSFSEIINQHFRSPPIYLSNLAILA